MTFSMKRVNAIFQKDLKDLLRNSAVSITASMPLIMAFILGKMSDDISIDGHYMVINIAMVTVGSFIQCCLIAEEKEKNTLRGLMLSPASTLEILGGKSLLSLIAMMIIVVIGAFLTGYHPEEIVIIMPFMLVFGFGSLAAMFVDKYPLLKVMEYTPNTQLLNIAVKVENGVGLGGLWLNFGIIALWIIAVFALTAIVFKKRKMD